MITRIEATRYRCLERVGVDLQAFGVLVGANGAGKTTLLDIPSLIGDCLSQRDISQAFTLRQNNRLPRSSTIKELFFCGQGNDFILAIEAALPESVISALLPSQSEIVQNNQEMWFRFIRYEIRFEIFNERQLIVKNEYLFLFSNSTFPERSAAIRLYGEVSPQKEWRFIIKREYGGEAAFRIETQKSGKPRSVHVDAAMLSLPRVQFESRMDFPAAFWLHDLLVVNSLFYQPDIGLLQTASPPGLPNKLMANAANLPWLAMELQKDESRFSLWLKHVQTALPQVSAIQVREREEDHYAYFVVTNNGGYEITSSGLSEGTLRILSLTILPYIQNPPTIIITEEPENGIHPRAIEAVLQSLSSVYDSQILASSHSPVVLANCKLDQILCSRLESSGAVTILPGTKHPQLVDWKGQVDLGALFAAGVLG